MCKILTHFISIKLNVFDRDNMMFKKCVFLVSGAKEPYYVPNLLKILKNHNGDLKC